MNYIIVDIETVAIDDARAFVPPPDLEHITPPTNYKKADAIADYIATRKVELKADYERDVTERAALDWNLNRIVAMGWLRTDTSINHSVSAFAETEEGEALLLADFWRQAEDRRIVGFCARTFDVPTLIQRSRLLGVRHPKVHIDRFGRGDVLDVRDMLTFDDARYESIMPRTLKAFARRFGIPVHDDVNGASVPSLVRAGEWDQVIAHVKSDVQLTLALAQKCGVIPTPTERPLAAPARDRA